MNNIKIGLDYHGVLTAKPDFFAAFTSLAISQGWIIHVVSGGACEDIKKYLAAHKIFYSKIWSMLDYFNNKHEVKYFSDGSFFVSNDLWNSAKADYCLAQNIQLHIDDSVIYGQYFKTPFLLYDEKMQNGTLLGNLDYKIDFLQSPEQVLDDVKNLISHFDYKR